MKQILFYLTIFCFFVLPFDTTAQYYYYGNDTLYVLAQSGLRMRDQPAGKNVVATLPYGAVLTVLEPEGELTPDSIDYVRGVWVKVVYSGKQGFVFSGYCSFLPAPAASVRSLHQYADTYFKKKGKPLIFVAGEEQNYDSLVVQYYTFRNFVLTIKENMYFEGYSEMLEAYPAYRVPARDLQLIAKLIYRKDIETSTEKMKTGKWTPAENPSALSPAAYYNILQPDLFRGTVFELFTEGCYEAISVGSNDFVSFVRRFGGC